MLDQGQLISDEPDAIPDAVIIEEATEPEPDAVVPAAYQSRALATGEEPVDGAWLLNLTDAWLGQYCWMRDAARHTLAMWVLAQHFRRDGRMIWGKFGHLLFIAERPGSGKTTMMRTAGYACAPWFFGVDNNPTAPGLCMTIAQEHATVCIDEAHRLIGAKGTRKADVVTIMCASFEQAGSYLNGRGGKANRIPVYAPMMIAAKKDPFLTSAGEEISDVIDRSVLIMCQPPPDGTMLKPETDETRAEGGLIAARAAAWAQQCMADPDALREAQVTAREAALDTGLKLRDVDVWLGMLTVAALASPGHLEAACEAARELRLHRPVTKPDETDPLKDLEASLNRAGASFGWAANGSDRATPATARRLLRDIVRVWPPGRPKMSSEELTQLLRAVPGAPWQQWEPGDPAKRELAAMLRPHDIGPVKLRVNGGPPVQGYTRDAFPALAAAA